MQHSRLPTCPVKSSSPPVSPLATSENHQGRSPVMSSPSPVPPIGPLSWTPPPPPWSSWSPPWSPAWSRPCQASASSVKEVEGDGNEISRCLEMSSNALHCLGDALWCTLQLYFAVCFAHTSDSCLLGKNTFNTMR